MKIHSFASSALVAVVLLAAVNAKGAAEMTFFTVPTSFTIGNPLPSTGAVFDLNGSTGLDSTFKGQVYAGTSSGSLTALTPVASFATAGGNAIASFNGFLIDNSTLTVAGVNPGAGFYQLKVWQSSAGASYEIASAVVGAKVGSSAVTAITFGGTPLAGGQGTPGPNIDNFTSFSVSTVAAVPEPATLALGLFGAAGLLFRRRK